MLILATIVLPRAKFGKTTSESLTASVIRNPGPRSRHERHHPTSLIHECNRTCSSVSVAEIGK